MKYMMIKILVLTLFSTIAFASKTVSNYVCDLRGTGSEPGEKVTIYLEDESPVLMECKIVLKTSFIGDTKYKVYADKAEWVQLRSGQPICGIKSFGKQLDYSDLVAELTKMMASVPGYIDQCSRANITPCETVQGIVSVMKARMKNLPKGEKTNHAIALSIIDGFVQEFESETH
jgi:hypothetical protein